MSWIKRYEGQKGTENEEWYFCKFIKDKCILGFPSCGLNETRDKICLVCATQRLVRAIYELVANLDR